MNRLIAHCGRRHLTGTFVVSMVVCLFAAISARAQLVTIDETFSGTSFTSNWVTGGTGYTPNLTAASGLDAAGSGWLRLTSAGTSQATYARSLDSFAATNATIAVKFSYAAYGGNGADGITFFLADASKTFGVGAYGGSLGYAQKTLAGGGEANMVGLSGGYIGLGIDEFGNYSNATEGRIGGDGFQPGNISVRGPGAGYSGYEYLGGTGDLSTPIAFSSATRPTGTDARVFQVVITASNQLTVFMQAGDSAPLEALYSIDLSGYARPEDLILGFTGSTGGQTNIHEIQGLMLTSQVARLWDNTSADSTWGNASNWDGTNGQIPGAGADVLLNNKYVSAAQTINVGGTRSIRSLQIDAPFDYTLNNGTLEFASQGILGPSGIFVSKGTGSATHTIGSALVAQNAIEISNTSSNTLTLSGTLATNGNAVTLSGSGNSTLSGVVSGGGALTKIGTGNTLLSGNNTYTGGTTLRAGTLTAGSNMAFGSGDLTIKGGTLASNNNYTVANDIILKGNAGLSNVTTSGVLTQTGGSYQLSMANATHTNVVNLSNNNTAGTLTVSVDTGGNSAITGVIQNGGTTAGNLTKTGTGTLTLGAQNAYTGTTTINAGTLQFGTNNALASTSSLNIAGGTLDLAGHSGQVGALSFSGGGVLDFGTSAGANTFVFNSIASQSGVLSINNWVDGADRLAGVTGGLNVGSIYFSGYGLAMQDTTQTNLGLYGSAFLIRPDTENWRTWLGDGDGVGRWSTSANWNPYGVPDAVGQYVLFTGTNASAVSELRDDRTISGLRFGPSAKAYTLDDGTGSTTLEMRAPVAGGIAFIQQQSSANQTFAFNELSLLSNTVIDVTGSGNLTAATRITGSQNLVKDGDGTGRLILSGNNSGFTGNIFVNAGTLRITTSSGLGSTTTGNTTIGQGSTLELTSGLNSDEAITFSGQGVGDAGAIRNFSGNNELGGPLAFTSDSRINSDAGTLTLSGALTSSSNRELRLGGAGNITINGTIANGTGAVVIDSTGSITYSGTAANTYSGATSLNSGTLYLGKTAGVNAIAGDLVIGDGTGGTATVRLNNADQISDTSRVTLHNEGLFNLNGRNETIGALSGSGGIIDNASATAATLTFGDTSSTAFEGVIRDSGSATLSLVKRGSGKITLTGANTYAGTTTLQGGIIAIQHNTALGSGAVSVASGANLEVSGNLTNVANAISISGPGTLANDGAIQSTSGTNTLTGGITLLSGSRVVADPGSTLNLNGAIGGTGQALTLGGGGNINVGGAINTGTAGTLTKEGDGYVVLSAGSNFTGATAIKAGTLEIRNANGLGTTAAGTTVSSGATLALSNTGTGDALTLSGAGVGGGGALRNIAGNNTVSNTIALGESATFGVDAGSLTASGVISGAAASSFTKVGSGTLTLSGTGANTLSGSFNVNDGTVILNKTANLNATGTGAISIGDGLGAANSATLQLGNTNQISNTAAVTLNTDGRFDLNSRNETIGSIAGSGNVTLGTGNTLTVGDASNTTFTGRVTTTGTGEVTKTGTGTLIIGGTDGSNSFAAAELNLSQGTVQLGANNILGTAINFAGGTFSVNGFNDTVSSATVTSSSVLDFNSLAGIFDLSAGIYIGGTLTVNGWAGSISGGGASQLLLPGSISGALLANINFTGYGAGAQIVNGEIVPITGTVYTWQRNGGGDWVTDANWSPNPPGTNIGPTGTGVSVIFGGAIGADSTITLAGGKTVGYITFNDNNRYTVTGSAITLAVNSGSAQINVSNSGGGTIQSAIVLNNALNISQNSSSEFSVTGGVSGTNRNITVSGSGNTLISGAITTGSGSITKSNEGTLTLSGANTYTGGTLVNGGTVAISSDGNLGGASGALTLNNGTLQNTANVVLGASRAVTVNAGGGTFLTDAGTTLTYNGVLAGAGTITKAGAGTFITGGAGANTQSGAVNITAGTLQVEKSANVSALGNTSAVTVGSDGTLRFNGSGAYASETIGSLAGAGTVNNASSSLFTLITGEDDTSTTFSGSIANTGSALSLTKTGTGTFTLSGASSYTGATSVSEGVLRIENASALGATTAGTSVTSGAALQLSGGIAVGNEALSLAGTGVGSTGALRNIDGNNSISGAITLSGGTTRIQSDDGTLTLSGNIGGAAQNLVIGGSGTTRLSGNIGTTTGTLTKADTGYAILSGANSSFTGTTSVTGGTLEIQSGLALGTSAGGVNVSSGATLAISGGISTAETPVTLSGSGYAAGGVLRSLSGNNTMSGGVALSSSSLINVDSDQLTLSGVVSGAGTLTKMGSGTLVLSNTNSYSGGTIVNTGTVRIAGDRGLGAVPGTVTAGNLTLNGGILETTFTGSLATNRGVALGSAGGTISTASGTTLTYGGVVAGTGSLTKSGSGTLVLTGTNTYTGATNLNGGTLRISSDAGLGTAPTSPTANSINFDGGTLATTTSFTLDSDRSISVGSGGGTLSVATGTTLAFGGTITGAGELTLALGGTGVFSLTSDINFTSGTILLSGGTLRLTNVDLNVGTFRITGDTILDFAGASDITATNFIVDAGVHLTINNWQRGVDLFLADHWWTDQTQTTEASTTDRGETPTNQVEFDNYTPDNTGWVPYDQTYGEITPVPEPSTYGLLFLASCVSVYGWRRRQKRNRAAS